MSANQSQSADLGKSQGALASFDTMSVRELNDLLERQNKILKNTSFVAKLPDKGAKLILTRDRIEAGLKAAEVRDSKKVLLEGTKTQLRPEDFEWAMRSLKILDLNDPEQVGIGCSSADSATRLNSTQVDSESTPTATAGPSGSAQFGPNELRHLEKLDTQAHNLILKDKFKPCHISNTISSPSDTVSVVKPKTDVQVGKQLRWDETLLPPSSAKTVKQLDWHESFEELQSHSLKLKDQTTESNDWKNKPYAFKNLATGSQDMSVLSKNTYDLADDSDDTDSSEGGEGDDHITEESEAEAE